MPALEDEREERLAQELAKGNTLAASYLNAGFRAKNQNSAASACSQLLKKRPLINERRVELATMLRTNAANSEFVASIDHLTKMLLEDRALAQSLGQISASVSALKEIRTLHGLGSENLNVKGELSLLDALTKARARVESNDAS